jgi:hypothetical protein
MGKFEGESVRAATEEGFEGCTRSCKVLRSKVQLKLCKFSSFFLKSRKP